MNERLAIGTITKAALLADADYLLSNFPGAVRPASWVVAYPQIVNPYAERFTTPGGDKSQGLLNFQWGFNLVNFDMHEYLYVDLMEYRLTRAVTVLTKNNFFAGTDKWVAINCLMTIWDLTPEGVNPVQNRLFREPVLRFHTGVYAADA